VNPTQANQRPPEWALEPVAAWLYLAITIALALTPLFPLNLVLGVLAAVFTFQDRRAQGFPTFWWTAGVLVLGPLVYLFFVYKRPRNAVVFTPEAAVSQQARLARGMPPKKATPGSTGAGAPADWYPDPAGNARLRYWNGEKWTEHTAA
jgi:hypothetical protein